MLNLDKIDLKKEIEELKKLSGKARGESIKMLVRHVRQKEGEEGAKKLAAQLKKLDYQLPDFNKIDDMEWIPVSIPTIYMVASVKFFNWQEKDIIEMGKNMLAFSKQIKFFIKYFVSPQKTFEIGARNWRKHYTFGKISVVEYDSENKMIKIRLENHKRHPVVCIFFQGLFSEIIEVATGSKKIIAEETKCMHKGDPYHEYVFKWE